MEYIIAAHIHAALTFDKLVYSDVYSCRITDTL